MRFRHLTLVLLGTAFAFSIHSQEIPVRLEVDIVGTSLCESNDSYKQVDLFGQINLINVSDSTFTFWMMKCAWTDVFVVEPSNIVMFVHECDGNYPVKVELQPDQSVVFNTIFEIPQDVYYESFENNRREKEAKPYDGKTYYSTFKIGFIPIKKLDSPLRLLWGDIIDSNIEDGNIYWGTDIEMRYYNWEWKLIE